MAQAAGAAMAALEGLAEADCPQTPSLQGACKLARQCIHARYGHMPQTGHSPHIRRAAGRVDQVLPDSIFKWLRNTTGVPPRRWL
eukprot:3912402-Alexandrium_andersonii.AAC.1